MRSTHPSPSKSRNCNFPLPGAVLSCSAKKVPKECGLREALDACSRNHMRPPLRILPAALSVDCKVFRCGNNSTETFFRTDQKRPGGSKGGAPRSESKMVDCRGQSLLDSAAWPVAVPDIFLGFQKPSSAIDRCHSLSSLALPPAALASLPARYRYAAAGGGFFMPSGGSPLTVRARLVNSR